MKIKFFKDQRWSAPEEAMMQNIRELIDNIKVLDKEEIIKGIDYSMSTNQRDAFFIVINTFNRIAKEKIE